MFHKILIPLDGSRLAETAIDAAVKFDGSAILLVTAIDLPKVPIYGYETLNPSLPTFEVDAQSIKSWAHAYLERVSEPLREQGFEVSCVVDVGDPEDVIVKTAAEQGADVIVMCTHGRTGVGRWLFGSVTHKVLGSAHCPVMVIPNRQKMTHGEGDITTTA
jgi:nucleotide-binding universal stress UspA family protein